MQTFTFNQLEDRAKWPALNRYYFEIMAEPTERDILALTKWNDRDGIATLMDVAEDIASRNGWRFTEHGERIA